MTDSVSEGRATLEAMPEAKPELPSTRDRLTNLDQAIKELLKSHPVDALEFLVPDAAKAWGKPLGWEFLNTTTRKHDLARKGYVMDLPIRYCFAKGTSPWSFKR